MNADVFENGDVVGLLNDDWSSLGDDMILVDREPVLGSTQCLVRSCGEERTVSRAHLVKLRSA